MDLYMPGVTMDKDKPSKHGPAKPLSRKGLP